MYKILALKITRLARGSHIILLLQLASSQPRESKGSKTTTMWRAQDFNPFDAF